MTQIYETLRQRLDDMATGFPETKSRIEMKLLKRLFTEKEAELFLQLSPMLEYVEDIAEKIGDDPGDLAVRLEEMAKKGLLFRQHRDDRSRYAAVPFIVGLYEYQLNNVDPEMAGDLLAYYEEGLGKTLQAFKTPVLRTIPIKKSLVAEWPVAPYEDVMNIIENQKIIGIAPCICRRTSSLAGRGCGKPLETCFLFGSHAHYYVENNMGRFITKEEAKEIVKNNDKAGLVMQPFNAQKVQGMCSCCGDCCGMLRSLKLQPVPAEAVKSNYYARVDDDECTGCETCVDRCQMDAIQIIDETADIDLDRCIGCGLCVTTCPVEAMHLVKKDEDSQYQPPRTGIETYMNIAVERGKM
jgi:Na+-translocating ferredoxin:NAD+ oxidoreductase RNF subunit RnfB